MRKMILLIITIISLFSLNVYAEDNDALDKVQEYLSQYTQYEDTFFVEEYYSEAWDVKNLFIRTNTHNDDTMDWISNRHNIMKKLVELDGFDYDNIYSITFSSASGMFICFTTYDVSNGILTLEGIPYQYVWITNSEKDLEKDKIMFLERVTKEILAYQLDFGVELITGDSENYLLSIEECHDGVDGVAKVIGNCIHDNREYPFIVEFKYYQKNETEGKYETLYVNINELELYGKYYELTDLSITRVE